MTPERAQAIARDVLAEITSGRRMPEPDGHSGVPAEAEAILFERYPTLTEYDRSAVLFRVGRMLSARATRAARARAGQPGPVPGPAAEEPRGDSMIADAISTRRQEKGLSLDDLASRIGVAPARMRNFELGHRRVPVAILARIAQVLDVDLGWFSSDRSAAPETPAAQAAEQQPGDGESTPNGLAEAPQPFTGDTGRDELLELYGRLTPGMRRAIVGVMREMVAERDRAMGENRRSA